MKILLNKVANLMDKVNSGYSYIRSSALHEYMYIQTDVLLLLESSELSESKVILLDVIVFKSCKLSECMKLRRRRRTPGKQSKSSQQVKYALVQRFNLEDLLNNVCCRNVCFYNRSAQQTYNVCIYNVCLQQRQSTQKR